jgi:SLT domain-containing protein
VPQSWVGPLIQIAKHESSGNPNAVNSIGLNPTTGAIVRGVGGEHATGLMQTLPSTFKQYALPGHTNIYNPLDNMIAAIRYIKARYGDPNVALRKSLSGGY